VNRYAVCDEDGELRSFYTKAEAIEFIGNRTDEFEIKVKPRKPKPDPMLVVGECLI
jgi:hypothetical protein